MNDTVDVSLFPDFKKITMNMIDDLEKVYQNPDIDDGHKASEFTRILKLYGCHP